MINKKIIGGLCCIVVQMDLPFLCRSEHQFQRLWSATSIVALDESYNRRVLGFSSVAEFYKACSCLHDLHRINVLMVSGISKVNLFKSKVTANALNDLTFFRKVFNGT